MLDPSQFVDGEGLVWSQNSSFDVGIMRQFNPKSVSLWEAKLDQDYIRYVEALCGREMALLGYDAASRQLDQKIASEVVHSVDRTYANWILKFVDVSQSRLKREHQKELIRERWLATDKKLSEGQKERICLSNTLYEMLRSNQMQATSTLKYPFPEKFAFDPNESFHF